MTPIAPFIEPRASDPRFATPRRYQMVIGGKRVGAQSGEVLTRESPADEGVIFAEIPKGGRADSEAAIRTARPAFDHGPWPRRSGGQRSRLIARPGGTDRPAP